MSAWHRVPKWAKWSLSGFALLMLIGAVSGSSGSANSDTASTSASAPAAKAAASKPEPSKPSGDSTVNKNSRAYLNAMAICQTAVALVRAEITKNNGDVISLTDDATQARDICDSTRSKLSTMSTDHFDDEAAIGFYAIDRYKSGLNAVLAYLDNPRPTKVIEARNKLQDGDQSAAEARHKINERRHVYGLRAIES